MPWFLIAIFHPLLHGFANIIDNYLSNKSFKNVWTLIFYSSFCRVLFLPLALLLGLPKFLPFQLFPALLLIAAIDIFYLYPYYKALQNDDTSVVTALFAVSKIFVPILAFFIVGEVLGVTQYVGFGLIIFGSAAISFKPGTKLKFSKSLFYMFFCSMLLALEAVTYKYIFSNVDWSTGFFWSALFSFFISLFFLFVPKRRKDIFKEFKKFKKRFWIFSLGELFTFGGNVASTLALSLIPVTVENGISSLQPIFVLFYAIIFGKFFPQFFKEKIDFHNIVKKVFIFMIMVVGILLVIK